MTNGGVNIITVPHDECPHCGLIKPLSWLVCRPCWKDIPWKLYVEHKTACHLCHHKENRNPERLERSRLADAAILSHLKQFSTAL